MSPRQIRYERAATRFMPRLWDFSYPITGRRFRRARLIALKAWALAFRMHMQRQED